MTRDDIVKMAHEAGLIMPTAGVTENQWKALEIFADLVCEACAQVCEEVGEHPSLTPRHCAEAIRARGQA